MKPNHKKVLEKLKIDNPKLYFGLMLKRGVKNTKIDIIV